jgi:toxin secretion/phage lysis holin
MVIAVLLFFVADTLLGIAKGVKALDYSSEKLRCAVVKGIVYGLALYVAFVFDWCFQLPVDATTGMAGILVLAELSSIAENLNALGVKLPAVMLRRMATARQELEAEDQQSTTSPSDEAPGVVDL